MAHGKRLAIPSGRRACGPVYAAGICFGVLEPHQFAAIAIKTADGTLTPLGVDQSKALWDYLKTAGHVDAKGKVQESLKLALKEGTLVLREAFEARRVQIAEVLRKVSGRLEVKNADERRDVPLRKGKDGKAVYLFNEFKTLWDRIKHQTTYRVQFDNAKLLDDCIAGLKKAPAIAEARLQWRTAEIINRSKRLALVDGIKYQKIAMSISMLRNCSPRTN